MNIKINDEKKLRELSGEFGQKPEDFLNAVVDGLSFPPGFKNESIKSSFSTALHRALWGSYNSAKLEEAIYEILGRYDYHIDDGEIDFETRTCWFHMYFTDNEKKLDLDEVHFQLNEGSSALVSATKTLEGISDWKNLESAQGAASEDMFQYLDDPLEIQLEFQDVYEHDGKEYLPMVLTVEEEEVSYLPKLDAVDNVLHEIEHKFRKAL